MKKVSNTFNKGLIMDVSPLSTTGDSLSDCLNGTFCTMNGDELVLQNDMGNGRVQTAYLPKGYIPIGTTQLGGIIYIASYNPFTNKCQIGSFPSPQRTSDKRDKLEKEIPLDKDENIIRVVLSDEIFKPGDKFYLTIPGQYMQYKYTESLPEIKVETENKSQAEIKKAKIAYVKQHFLKFSVAIISEESQIIKLNEDPIIEEPKNNTEDDFTKDINKFKVCTSKISGKLILIIERVTFDYSINFNAFSGIAVNSGNPTFYLNFNLNANSQDKFFPNKLVLESSAKYNDKSYEQTLTFPTKGEFTSGNSPDFRSFNYSAKNIYNNNVVDPVITKTLPQISQLVDDLTDANYWGSSHNPVYLNILATLYTNNFKINSEGEKIGECLPAATKQYVIDLSKVASNTVELSRYTYTIVDGSPISAEITFALQTYLDSAYEIKSTIVNIYNVKDNSINKVGSGALEGNTVTFENLENNYLYLIEFQIKTGKIEAQEDGSFDEKIINIYRYLYSNPNIVASFDKELTDYEQAVPTLTLEAKVEDEKLIPDNPSSSEINYPHGLASTDDIEFIGTEKQIWKLKDKVSISITEKNNIPVEIISITANNKECDKVTNNKFLIDTGLQNQELKFNYKYNSSQVVQKTCNILERVSDYLFIAKQILIAQYPGYSHGVSSGLNEDLFEIVGGNTNTFNANTFKRFYNNGSYAEDYSSELYGFYLNGHYTIYPIQFQVRSESQNNYYVTDTLIQNSNITGTYLIKPGDGINDMLFSLYEPSMNEEYNWELQSEYLQDIFNVLYTYREAQPINIRYAKSIQKEETKIISINKSIETSNVNIDLTTSDKELFTQLTEVYDSYYSKNNYKKPIINNLKITLNETKSDIKSTLLKSYPITIDSSNDILLKSNNKLYKITHRDLHNNKIYTAQIQDIENIIISDSFNVTLHDGLTYNGVAKQFYASKGKLYMKSVDRTEYIRMGTQSYIKIELPIETALKNNVIK